jgi:hypothetical protein
MRALVAAAVLAGAIALGPSVASAQERVGDAALGALSGALVAGPVGLVAGGVIGFAAGPNISHAMFHHRKHSRRYARQE